MHVYVCLKNTSGVQWPICLSVFSMVLPKRVSHRRLIVSFTCVDTTITTGQSLLVDDRGTIEFHAVDARTTSTEARTGLYVVRGVCKMQGLRETKKDTGQIR